MSARTALRCTAGLLAAAALGLLVGLLSHRPACVTLVVPPRAAIPTAELGKPLDKVATIPQVVRGCTEPSGVTPALAAGLGGLLLLGTSALAGRRGERAPQPAPEGQREELVASLIYAIDRASSPAVAARLSQDLEKAGVRSVGIAGECFDPALHEAVATVPVEGGPAGIVSSVDEPGYAEGERLLRPARVIVTRTAS